MKQLLAILGSPHRDGSTAAMLQYAVSCAEAAGWNVERVNLYEKKIGYCTGCRSCIKTGGCIYKDDAEKVARMLKGCDTVILAAPVYWANVPAAVKNLFDRLLGTAMEETKTFPKPRLSSKQKYFLLTACNTPFPFSWLCGQSRGALRAMDEFFRTSGMKCMGKIVYAGAGGKKDLPQRVTRRIQKCWLPHNPPQRRTY